MCKNCEKVKEQLMRRQAHHGYVPIPLWNGKEWIPITMSIGEKEMCWPEGFDPSTLPRPRYQLGDIVRFKWERPSELQGYIQRISMWGGGYQRYEGDAPEVCAFRYRRPFMTYTIYASAHGRWVKESWIYEKVGVKENPIV